jgi:hypothetical protein
LLKRIIYFMAFHKMFYIEVIQARMIKE